MDDLDTSQRCCPMSSAFEPATSMTSLALTITSRPSGDYIIYMYKLSVKEFLNIGLGGGGGGRVRKFV